MSFIALALTLCTLAGSDDQKCNTYYIDAFAGDIVEGQTFNAKPVALPDQWGDCMTRLDEETSLARLAAKFDHATKPTAKDGQSTSYRAAYLKRFNIVEDVKNIDRWEYGCAKVKEDDTP